MPTLLAWHYAGWGGPGGETEASNRRIGEQRAYAGDTVYDNEEGSHVCIPCAAVHPSQSAVAEPAGR